MGQAVRDGIKILLHSSAFPLIFFLFVGCSQGEIFNKIPTASLGNHTTASVLQSIGGTGPLRAGAELLRRRLGFTRAVYSDPTWINHRDIFEMAGFDRVEPYTYYDRQKQGIIQNLCRAPD